MDKKGLILYVLFVVLLFGSGFYLIKSDETKFTFPNLISSQQVPTPTQMTASRSAEFAVVKRVVDGDTIELVDGRKVRYIGVDTPELHHPTKGVQCFGKEAMEKNKELVEGKTVRMEKDVSETDRYKRLLRYVWKDEVFVNEYLAREGYALQATFPPDVAYTNLFKEAAQEAREQNKGLWSACK